MNTSFRPDKTPFLLIVDDDEEDREFLKDCFNSLSVPTRLEFLPSMAELRTYVADRTVEQLPDLIIIDMYYPGESAVRTVHFLRSNPLSRLVPILMLSDSNSPSDIRDFYEHGGTAYIQKPVSMERLQSILDVLWKFWFSVVELPTRQN